MKRQMGRYRKRKFSHAGFTLVELMITIAVLAVLSAIAVPSMTGLINGNRLTGQANELVSALQMGRSEAIRQNASVTVCGSVDGELCSEGSEADTGWTHWLVRGGRDNAVIQSGLINTAVEIDASNFPVKFRPDGLARSAAGTLAASTITVCIPTTRPAENRREIQLTGGSRIGVVAVNGAGGC